MFILSILRWRCGHHARQDYRRRVRPFNTPLEMQFILKYRVPVAVTSDFQYSVGDATFLIHMNEQDYYVLSILRWRC